MAEEFDTKKSAKQLIELESFFSDFAVTKRSDSAPPQKGKDIAGTLAEIEDEIRACRRCELGTLRTNAVPGEGNCQARLVFVGEGPGEDEDRLGRPFVGRAGRLLDKIIVAMGLKRSDVFICNILKCRPPNNRDPRPAEIVSCLPFLKRQLELIKPEVIVALGAHAARTLLETNRPIGQLRGRFHDFYVSDFENPVSLMPTYHPAYLLRNYSYENRQRVWEDMKKVLDLLGLPVPNRTVRQ